MTEQQLTNVVILSIEQDMQEHFLKIWLLTSLKELTRTVPLCYLECHLLALMSVANCYYLNF